MTVPDQLDTKEEAALKSHGTNSTLLNQESSCASQPEQPTTTIEGSHDGGVEREVQVGEEGRSEAEPEDGDNFYAGGARGEALDRKTKHWTESPFAVGCVNVAWQDDRPSGWCSSSRASRDVDRAYPVTSIVCSCLGADRVGNLSVLAQSTEEYDEPEVDPESGVVLATHRKTRPRLLWVCGPYWTVNLFVTFPLILVVSGYVGYRRVFRDSNIVVQITWLLGTCLLTVSLAMISCRNPGVLYRHSQAPPGTEDWRWNDQARTYRPPKARFDPECQVVIEGFDHTYVEPLIFLLQSSNE